MKPRARRVTLTAAVLGAGVVSVLVIAHWGAVRDHVEAWHFQLTRETETIEPNPVWPELLKTQHNWEERLSLGILLANCSGRPVIVHPTSWEFVATASAWAREGVTTETVLQGFRENDIRVLDQRFPRTAYVVIRDEASRETVTIEPSPDSP